MSQAGPPSARPETQSASPRWTLRHALLTVAIVAALVRLVCMSTLSLVMTNDSVEYLHWGERMSRGDFETMPHRVDRTPGYPLLIAANFALFGVGPLGIVVMQHAFGFGLSMLVAWIACVRGSPAWGTFAGLMCTLDPWLLTFERFALTEIAATLFAVLVASVVLLSSRITLPRSLLLGLLLGFSMLLRPSFQVFAPFVILGWTLAAWSGWRRGVTHLGAASAAAALVVGPWMWRYHAAHGSWTLSGGSGAHLWSGVARVGMQKEDFRLPEDVRGAYSPFSGKPLDDGAFWSFCYQIDGLGRREPLLKQWALASIAADPERYLRYAAYAVLWQLSYYPESGPIRNDERRWYVDRLARGADGVQYEGAYDPLLAKLNLRTEGGLVRRFFGGVADRMVPGLPQIPIAIGAVLLLLAALLRRDFAAAGLYGGSIAFVLVHAAFLFPNSRYAMPMWTVWYITLSIVPAAVTAALRRMRARDESSAHSQPATARS